MKFRLALALGKTVSELESRLSGRELMEWAYYFSMNPPDYRADWRMARICQAVLAAAGKKTKVSDFLPNYGRDSKDIQTPEQQIAMLRALTDQPQDEESDGDSRHSNDSA